MTQKNVASFSEMEL